MSSPLIEWLQARPLAKRLKDAQMVRTKYEQRLPVVVFPATKSTPSISAHKFLVPEDLTVGQFLHLLRLRITLKPEQAIFIFATHPTSTSSVDTNVLLPVSDLMKQVYQRHRSHDDDFLYLIYDIENTFGCM